MEIILIFHGLLANNVFHVTSRRGLTLQNVTHGGTMVWYGVHGRRVLHDVEL